MPPIYDHAGHRDNSATNDLPQNALLVISTGNCRRYNRQGREWRRLTNLVYLVMYLYSFSNLADFCASLMETASLYAAESSSVFHGLMMILPLRLWAAPANSDKMRTPLRFCWVAMYSKETRFMPSRVDETTQTSEMAYREISSSKFTDLCMK